MKMWRIFLLWLIPSATLADLGPDVVSDVLLSHEAGVICAPPTAGEAPAPDTVAGSTHLIDVEPAFVSIKRRVPAVIGIGFGIKAQAADLFGVPGVTITVSHPAMGETRAISQSFASRVAGDKASLTFYQFDFDYELVTGIWQFEAKQGDMVIYRTTFEVVTPQQMPELAEICGFTDLLS